MSIETGCKKATHWWYGQTGRALRALIALALAGSCSPDSQQGDRTTVESAERGAAKAVDYAPGVRIDFRVPKVEIACEVILREGPLELFAYSKAPVPKEHESILKTNVPCSTIFQALGLIGLQPGHTARYFPETRTERAASGDPVEVRVRYELKNRVVEQSVCDWMIDVAAGQPMAPRAWVFSGSERDKSNRFAADEEGTFVTVVDFPSSLLSLATSHSSSDTDLWLKANSDAIPPLGTAVTVILQPAKR